MNDIVTSIERKELFELLCHETLSCRECARLADRAPVLSRSNGTLLPKVLFVGEAPSRRGADRPCSPFASDQPGSRLEELLASIDLSRHEIFITHTVLCCPSDDAESFSPSFEEIRNCSRFLRDTIHLLRPPVVATMGAVALRTVGRMVGQPLVLADVAGTVIECPDFLLVPLYSPNPRVLNTVRKLEQQKVDFTAIRDAVEWTTAAVV